MTTHKSIHIVDSSILSDYILERGGIMSHLKMQKLIYYIQALHLAYFDQPIIEDDFQAWLHGSVSRKIYNEVKDFSMLYDEIEFYLKEGERQPSVVLSEQLTADQLELINEVIDEYGKLTSSQLENLTHSEAPWIEARKGYSPAERCEVVIPKEAMRNFYKKEMYGEKI